MKTIWDITRTLTGVKVKKEDIDQLNINVDIYYNFQTIPDFPNNYILHKIKRNKTKQNKTKQNKKTTVLSTKTITVLQINFIRTLTNYF
jgi:hypothetical protein